MSENLKNFKQNGFTALEVLIAIAILVILVGIIYSALSNLNNGEVLSTETNTILSMVETARDRTVSGDSASQYGIHFASTTATLFMGTTYVVGSSTNQVKNINSQVKVNSVNLSSHGYDLYFYPLTGKPSATGTVVFSLVSNSASQKTLTIYSTGISDIK